MKQKSKRCRGDKDWPPASAGATTPHRADAPSVCATLPCEQTEAVSRLRRVCGGEETKVLGSRFQHRDQGKIASAHRWILQVHLSKSQELSPMHWVGNRKPSQRQRQRRRGRAFFPGKRERAKIRERCGSLKELGPLWAIKQSTASQPHQSSLSRRYPLFLTSATQRPLQPLVASTFLLPIMATVTIGKPYYEALLRR